MNEINYGANMTMADPPVIHKQGVVAQAGEMTPFVRQGRLMQVETQSAGDPVTLIFEGSFVIRDLEAGTCTKPVAPGWHFFSAYCEGATVYVFGTNEQPNRVWGGDTIRMFWSDDLVSWQFKDVIRREGWLFYNTSVCRGDSGYVMAIEAGRPREQVGVPFTTFFARSDDLHNWTMMPDDICYSRDRYIACPALRYVADDGYYYMVCLEALPKARYAPYIYRTRDFITWEIGLHNPILWISKEDRMIKEGITFDGPTTELIHSYLNINNCDVDFCEYQGKTIISYLTGDQLGTGFMCEAVYDGPLNDFLQAFFR
jgi:hypothetical protein